MFWSVSDNFLYLHARPGVGISHDGGVVHKHGVSWYPTVKMLMSQLPNAAYIKYFSPSITPLNSSTSGKSSIPMHRKNIRMIPHKITNVIISFVMTIKIFSIGPKVLVYSVINIALAQIIAATNPIK
jgi:hypothetical protein